MHRSQCGTCGGVIADLTNVSFELPDPEKAPAAPREDPCRCARPIVYGPPAGFASIPKMRSVKRPAPAPAPEPDDGASRGSKRPR
jgi:hypothetical protein